LKKKESRAVILKQVPVESKLGKQGHQSAKRATEELCKHLDKIAAGTLRCEG
jgi:hypothetical protein